MSRVELKKCKCCTCVSLSIRNPNDPCRIKISGYVTTILSSLSFYHYSHSRRFAQGATYIQ